MVNMACSSCGEEMVERGERKIGGDTYHILYCEICKKQVARLD